MSNRAVTKRFISVMDEIVQCCEVIEESERSCSDCPLHNTCIKEYPLVDFYEDVPYGKLTEFFDTADELTSYVPTREEWEADQGNLRRCDPDDMD